MLFAKTKDSVLKQFFLLISDNCFLREKNKKIPARFVLREPMSHLVSYAMLRRLNKAQAAVNMAAN